MAAAVGSSARLLIFRLFVSKERLLLEVLDEMRRRLQASLADLSVNARLSPDSPLCAYFGFAGIEGRQLRAASRAV